MRNFFILPFCLLCSLTSISQEELKEIADFGNNPGNLDMFLHTPQRKVDSVKNSAFRPLVVVLHGCNQTVKHVARQSGWNSLADYFDFYVIYPGQKRLNNASDCFNWFNEKDISRNSGESGSIKQMIDHMRKNYGIDSTQIFVYGLSAGAAMTSVLMATYPETFNAGAVLAGGPYKMALGAVGGFNAMIKPKIRPAREWSDLVRKDNPGYKGKYPRLVICHGKSDKIVSPKNSYELVKQWSDLLGTDTVPGKTLQAFAGKADVEKKIYCSKDSAEKIFFYEVTKAGHALIIDPGEPPIKGGETGLFAVDKDFFSTYWIAKDFGLVP